MNDAYILSVSFDIVFSCKSIDGSRKKTKIHELDIKLKFGVVSVLDYSEQQST